MGKLFRPIVIIPTLLGIAISFWGFVKIRERQKFQAALKHSLESTQSSGPLPKGKLVHLASSDDYYEAVGRGSVLLVYLTTNCGACNKEVLTVSETLPKLPAHLAVYGVFFEERDQVEKFFLENSIKFPVLLDKGGLIFNGLKLKHFPAKILIENGNVMKIWVGSSPNGESLLKELATGQQKL